MLNDDDYVLFLKILDEIIPAGGIRRMPSAGVKAVADSVLSATAYSNNPTATVTLLLDAVRSTSPRFLQNGRGERIAHLKAVETEHPERFSELVRLTYMAYYSRPEIRPLLGVGAHPVHPGGYAVERESATSMDELTAPVRARGAAYRKA